MESEDDALLQLGGLYLKGKTALAGAANGQMVLTSQGQLVLTVAEGTKEAPQHRQVFSVALSDVTKLKLFSYMLTVVTGGTAYRFEISRYHILNKNDGQRPEHGMKGIVEVLRAHGGHVSYTSKAKIYVITLIVIPVLVIAMALLAGH